jgi:hypothetical protein
MSVAAHAKLSPSSAERWISCPASIRMTEAAPPDEGSSYANEGTAAHEMAELMAREQILGSITKAQKTKALKVWRKQYDISEEAEEDMVVHGQGYVDYLKERMLEHPGSVLLLEQRLPTGIKDSWGTSDSVIVSFDYIESCDYKYGAGVKVEAERNPQTRLYGVGALEAYGDLLGDVQMVRLTVYQPRLNHVVWEEIPASELREWRDSLIPIAESALGPDAPFGPSDSACRWCPASGSCMAQMEWATERDFGVKPDFMSEDELAKSLDDIPLIKKWCAAVESHALDAVYSKGQEIPGYKVVMSGGKRSVTDSEGLINTAIAIGYTRDEVSNTKARGIGELEKILKKDFGLVAGPFVTKGTGSPSLVPESDRRTAINPETQAAEDFA